MADPQPLANLRDIHLPEPIGWWPLATGWYVLIALVLLLLACVGYYLYRRFRNNRAKKQALEILSFYQQQYEHEGNTPFFSAKISELLRRVALVYYPRSEVASLQGDAWIDFLNTTGKQLNFQDIRDYLLLLPYQHSNVDVDIKPLFTQANAWIRQRGVPCLN